MATARVLERKDGRDVNVWENEIQRMNDVCKRSRVASGSNSNNGPDDIHAPRVSEESIDES